MVLAPESRTGLTNNPPFFAIDGPHAHEIDDAIQISRLRGGFLVQVAVADGLKIAEEKFEERIEKAISRRQNKYYGDRVERRILDEDITEDLSLRTGSNDALVIKQWLGSDGQYGRPPEILPAKVSVERTTYENFGNLYDYKGPTKNYFDYYQQFRANYGLKQQHNWMIVDKKGPESLSKQVVRSAMILANIAVGQWAYKNKVPLLYQHFPVVEDANEGLPTQAGYASYVASPFLHYGIPEFKEGVIYPPTTSPLRRSADLVNHIQIGHHIAGKQLPFTRSDLEIISTRLNPSVKLAQAT